MPNPQIFMPIYFLNLIHFCSSCVFFPHFIFHVWSSKGWLHPSSKCSARFMRYREGGKWNVRKEKKRFAWVCAKQFLCEIYCGNQRPDTSSQSGSFSHMRLVRLSQQIIHEYNCTNTISKIDSSVFAAMSPIKFADKTRASFSSTP